MNPLLDFDHPPLSLLEPAQRRAFDRACDIVLFQAGERPLKAGEPSASVYFVIKGQAQALQLRDNQEQPLADYGPGDVLGAFAVIQGEARFTYVVREDLLCHAVDANVFRQVLDSNERFAAWFNEGLSAKRSLWQRAAQHDVANDVMLTRVADARLAPAVWLHPQSSLREARLAMKRRGVSCVLLRESPDAEPGILTRTDLLDALALSNAQPDDALASWVTRPLISIDAGDVLFQSLVLMTERHVERVVVRDKSDGDAILGTLGMGEVLSHFSSHSHLIGLELARADTLEAVQQASRRVPELVRVLHAQGARMSYLMEMVSALNTRLFKRLFELILPAEWQPHCCVLVLGSEGRREQILRTDQDNMLIHPTGLDEEELQAVCERFSEALIGCGFPPCPGGVMLRNAQWRGDLDTWRRRIDGMVGSSSPQDLMDLAILLDARCVAGDEHVFEQLAPHLFDAARNTIVLHHFANAALAFGTPLTLFGRLRAEEHRLDIKKGGIFPLVQGLRALALRERIPARNSFERAAALAEAGVLSQPLGRDAQQAMAIFQRLRLGQQLDALQRGEVPDNQLRIDALRRLDRELLRDAIGVVDGFKQALRQQFHL
ncbi:MAG: putative nucleotidyltransferase substrate binding domain-containing protein [Lysobacteraceae bacterium]